MGTNYNISPPYSIYTKITDIILEQPLRARNFLNACLDIKDIHIGKHSAGWVFTFRKSVLGSTYEEVRDSIFELSKAGWIVKNEYGNEIYPEELFEWINETKHNKRLSGDYYDDDGWPFMESEFN